MHRFLGHHPFAVENDRLEQFPTFRRHHLTVECNEIAFEVAQKIVAGMPISAELVEATVREAISEIEHKSDLTVQLNPEDFSLLKKHNSPALDALPGADSLRFTTATEIGRGGCIVVTKFGVLDARRETKIEQLRKSLA